MKKNKRTKILNYLEDTTRQRNSAANLTSYTKSIQMSSIEPDTPMADTPREPTVETTPSVDGNHDSTTDNQQQQQQESSEQKSQQPTEEQEAQQPKEEQELPQADIEKLKQEFQEKAKNYLAEQTAHVVIPSFAKWFSLSEVHSIEKKSFPDFFVDPASSYKTPQSYKYIRDFIVNTFRLNPKEYLTVTAVRRNLSGDVTNIIRIHQFLEKWGIINYQIDPRTKPTVVGPQYTGHFQITLDTPEGLVPFVPANAQIIKKETTEQSNTPSLPSPAPEIKSEETQAELSLNLEIRRDVYATGDKKSTYKSNNLVQYACSICGKDATEVRYHNLKIKSYSYNPSSTINNASILCSLCFEQGLFPLNFTSSDFIQLQNNKKSAEWTEQEILLLLEGIEMFATYEAPNANGTIASNSNAQWDKISEHVGTKTREQCIIKFIQLPIEDKFLTKLIREDESQKSSMKDNAILVQEVVKKLIETKQGQDLLQDNSMKNLQESILEESNLINQVIELTLEKFNLKLQKLESLQENLIKIEEQLNLERKQVLIERWVQFEKIQKLKQQRPELTDILDDLIHPVRVTEINKSLNPVKNLDNEDKMEVDEKQADEIDSEKLPISISQPKAYQCWSG